MKKKSQAFEDGYNFMYMIGRCDVKEINTYYKSFGLNKKERDQIDDGKWNEYDIGGTPKQQEDFKKGKLTAIQEMLEFNKKIESVYELYTQYKHCQFEGDHEMWIDMNEMLEYTENKKELEKLLEKYYQGIKARDKFFSKLDFKPEYEI